MFRKYALFAVLIPLAIFTEENVDVLQRGVSEDLEPTYYLQLSDSLELPLEGPFGQNGPTFTLGFDGKEYVSYLDFTDDIIYHYDLSQRNPSAKKIEIQESDRQSPKIQGKIFRSLGLMNNHLLISPDSFFVINSHRITLVDADGASLTTYEIAKNPIDLDSLEESKEIYPMTIGYPWIRHGNTFFYSTDGSFKQDYENVPSIVKYDCLTKKKSLLAAFPPKYQEGQWGLWFSYVPTIAPSLDGKGFIVSYPIDPQLYQYDWEGNLIDSFLVNSSFRKDPQPFHPAPSHNPHVEGTYSQAYDYTFSRRDFRYLLVDPYQQLYYRITALRKDFDSQKDPYPGLEFSLIVCDKNFNILTEKRFESDTYSICPTVSSKGLVMLPTDKNEDSDKEIRFDFFTLKKE
ncbi:MAG: DUF4221 family protein [Bacteroidota bacterium]